MDDRLEGVHKLLESFYVLTFSPWEGDKMTASMGIRFQLSLSKLRGKSEIKKRAESGASCICHFELILEGGGEKGEDEKP